MIEVNGQKKELPPDLISIQDLIGDYQLDERTVAVEYNGSIIARQGWSQTILRDGDRIEIIRFVGGG
ncbi:MAG: sulfur carrier protein ThiS [Leptospiraceae bacterium]|nr:sulfur carrier protein ThiS [Leptospiraceae bacterium]